MGFEPMTSRITIWRYYQLSYSRRTDIIVASDRWLCLLGVLLGYVNVMTLITCPLTY